MIEDILRMYESYKNDMVIVMSNIEKVDYNCEVIVGGGVDSEMVDEVAES